MFRVSQHPSSGVLKAVIAASGTGHNTGTATSLQRGPIGLKATICFVMFAFPHVTTRLQLDGFS